MGAIAIRNHENKQIVSSNVLAMIIFVILEVMFFAAFISAFLIVKSGADIWPPAGQDRLPFWETAFNTALLLISGVFLFLSNRAFHKDAASIWAKRFLAVSMVLGVFFVLLQGIEWVSLINYGLTMKSSNYGSFFYMIVGAHALHAIAAIVALLWAYLLLRKKALNDSQFFSVQIFWYFVVALWPILYFLIYLN